MFCCFLTDSDEGKKYALYRNNRIQRNIRKRNQSFGYVNRFRFIFGLKTRFEMSEGRLNVSEGRVTFSLESKQLVTAKVYSMCHF